MASCVRFYILPDSQQEARWWFACRLAAKCWHQRLGCHIQLPDQAQLEQMDALLWSFREDSFLPHALAGGAGEPVVLGCTPDPVIDGSRILINISDRLLENSQQASSIVEIVVQDPVLLPQARSRLRLYKKAGFDVRCIRVSPQREGGSMPTATSE